MIAHIYWSRLSLENHHRWHLYVSHDSGLGHGSGFVHRVVWFLASCVVCFSYVVFLNSQPPMTSMIGGCLQLFVSTPAVFMSRPPSSCHARSCSGDMDSRRPRDIDKCQQMIQYTIVTHPTHIAEPSRTPPA